MSHIDIVMSGEPGPDSEFVEVEDQNGAGIKIGEWVHRGDGFWALRVPTVNGGPITENEILRCPHGAVLCFRCIQDSIADGIASGFISVR